VARKKKRNQRHALLIPLSGSGYNIQTSAGRLLRGEFDYQPRIAAAQIEINLRYAAIGQIENDFRIVGVLGIAGTSLLCLAELPYVLRTLVKELLPIAGWKDVGGLNPSQ